ncbi:methyltransferase [Actinosynnema pretiosum]|uniref:SAM-dependent methyltransferase n=1 Tax=Actinosynnema pretiosum TaxID=42197 RepID=A0A290Z0X1_9PSEU|nr:methyltransferase [Actinosynnema pretiosum]ATE52648.1 SAM-dependent methyltransferase [Actinosynnema pretiosum]
MAAHTADGIDWNSRLADLRRADGLQAEAARLVAARLVDGLPDEPTVVDVGSGAGGMALVLAEALAARGGGTLVLVDAVPELLDAATAAARKAAAYETDSHTTSVRVRPVLGDLSSEQPSSFLPTADLVWASGVVHHLPDQAAVVSALAASLAPGGLLALAEGGLDARFLPWDIGVGSPGLADRLSAARGEWFAHMREKIPGSVRLTKGWGAVLTAAGLRDVSAFSYLVDHPAPTTPQVRDWALAHVRRLAESCGERLHPADRAVLRDLLDSGHPAYLGARDDLFLLSANTVHTGRKA